jgi:hypothetical protein
MVQPGSSPRSIYVTVSVSPSVLATGVSAAAVPPWPAQRCTGPIELIAGSVRTPVTVPTTATPLVFAFGRVLDAAGRFPVASVTAHVPASGPVQAVVNRQTGEYLVTSTAPRVWIGLSADGYMPCSSQAFALTSTGVAADLCLEPVLGGAFRGASVVFDAEPGSGATRFLSRMSEILVGTGVLGVWAAWSGQGEATEQDRARVANRLPADLAVTILSSVGETVGGPVVVNYYHASDKGKAVAAAVADSFRRYSPSVKATSGPGATYFLNNTRATTLGLTFSGRRSPRLTPEEVAYVVFHGLARALRPDLPRGRTYSGQLPAGAASGAWVYLDSGDRCRAGATGRFTFLDVQPGRHTLWIEAPAASGPGRGLTVTIDVP